MIQCKYCKGDVDEDAIKCKHCGEFLKDKPKKQIARAIFMALGLLISAFFAYKWYDCEQEYSKIQSIYNMSEKEKEMFRKGPQFTNGAIAVSRQDAVKAGSSFSQVMIAVGLGVFVIAYRKKKKLQPN
jgi:uncharacterized paraquat-inducible protein A